MNAFSKTFSYSFGVSRQQMKKIHVDEILKKKEENLPGPGNYQHKQIISATDSIHYSLRPKHNDITLKRAKGLPGPGYYHADNLTGVKPTNSKMMSTFQYGFPKDERFKVGKDRSPPPNNYHPKQDLNQNFNSIYKYAGATKIGREKQNSLEQIW